MIYLKTSEEINLIHQGGQILSDILDKLCQETKIGTSTAYLENLALAMIAEAGGRPAFKDYNMGGGLRFPSALCISINEEVVHGPAIPDRIIKDGDIVDIDIGMEWPLQSQSEASKNSRPYNKHSRGGGFYTDTCRTVAMGKISSETEKLLRVCQESLNIGIKKAVAGNTLNDIGGAIEDYVLSHGFSVVKDLVGHGLGYFAHEDPHVFNYRIPKDDQENLILQPGMVIAIEPMINQGREDVRVADNGFTIVTADNSLSAHFEHSIAILDKGNLILT